MFSSVKSQRVSDEIVLQIRGALVGGKLQVGDKLPAERELAERFETSRASVREALRSLQQEGLIRIKKGVNGGIFVADLLHQPVRQSFQNLLQLRKISIHDIAEARLIFEPQAARLAAERATAADLRELGEVIESMSEAVSRRELPGYYDLRFHQVIARAARNPVLDVLAASMLEIASKTISELNPSLETVRHVLRCHGKIFEAVCRGDGDAAFEAMREHIVDVQDRLAKHATHKQHALSGC